MMGPYTPLVSVILPTYNRCNLLPRAVGSILGQTYVNLECIIVDDGSTDGTARIVQEFTDKRVIYLRHQANRHASAARNTGIKHGKGDFFAFLDDDDEWLPEKLEKQIAHIRQCPESVGMIYCWMDYYDVQENLTKKHHPTFKGYVFKHVLDKQRIGGCPTLLIRRAVIDEVGDFDESLRRGNDGDFIRRVTKHYLVDYVPEVLVKVHVGHGDRISVGNHGDRIAAIEKRLDFFRDDYNMYQDKKATTLAHLGTTCLKSGLVWKSLNAFAEVLRCEAGWRHKVKLLLNSAKEGSVFVWRNIFTRGRR